MSAKAKALSLGIMAAALLTIVAALAVSQWTGSTASTRRDRADVLDLSTQPADIAATYHYIENHAAMASRVPCYCGCGRALGHLSLLDCYLIEPRKFSSHASGCLICGREAADLERLAGQGQTVSEIRTRIDAEYSQYGLPTNAPK